MRRTVPKTVVTPLGIAPFAKFLTWAIAGSGTLVRQRDCVFDRPGEKIPSWTPPFSRQNSNPEKACFSPQSASADAPALNCTTGANVASAVGGVSAVGVGTPAVIAR